MRRKVDTAEAADWSFTENPVVMEAVEWAVNRVRRNFPFADLDDARQESYLWLAVRPSMIRTIIERFGEEGATRRIALQVYSGALRDMFLREGEWHVSLSADPYGEGV